MVIIKEHKRLTDTKIAAKKSASVDFECTINMLNLLKLNTFSTAYRNTKWGVINNQRRKKIN